MRASPPPGTPNERPGDDHGRHVARAVSRAAAGAVGVDGRHGLSRMLDRRARQCNVGEVVFNTAMTGYQEILTDPIYCRPDRHADLSAHRQRRRQRRRRRSPIACLRRGPGDPRPAAASRRTAGATDDSVGVPAQRERRRHRRHRHAQADAPPARARARRTAASWQRPCSPTRTPKRRIVARARGALDGRARPRQGGLVHDGLRLDARRLGARQRLSAAWASRDSTSSPSTSASSTTSCACWPSAAAR